MANCTLNIDLDGDGEPDPTPAIIKFAVSDILSAGVDYEQVSTLFPSVTGAEFVFSNFVFKDVTDLVKFDFAYTLGAGDPAITAVAVKGSNNNTVSTDFTFAGGVFSGTLYGVGCSATVLTGRDCKGVSNVVFFDTGAPDGEVPLPAAGLLLAAGLGGLSLLKRSRRRA